MLPWEEFCRLRSWTDDGFYGCLDRDGYWFDSSSCFLTAIHWCCLQHGEFDLSPDGELNWMQSRGRKLGLSIVHSSMLRKMYEAGLVK